MFERKEIKAQMLKNVVLSKKICLKFSKISVKFTYWGQDRAEFYPKVMRESKNSSIEAKNEGSKNASFLRRFS